MGGDSVQPARPRRLGRLPAVAASAALLLAVGVLTAFALPVVPVGPERTLAQVLPGTTVFYASVDLHPTGPTRTYLNQIEQDFTQQPGWASLMKDIRMEQKQNPSASNCYSDAQSRAGASMDELGHDAAIALVDTKGFGDPSAQGLQASDAALQNNGVVLAAINVRTTLAQRIFGLPFSLDKKTRDYNGVTIYQHDFNSCGRVGFGVPHTLYMALDKGYAILGLSPRPLERVIDTASGTEGSLAAAAPYTRLMALLPGNALLRDYVDGTRLGSLGAGSLVETVAPVSGVAGSAAPAVQQSAGVVTVDAEGLHMETASLQSGGSTSIATAGTAAAFLPHDILGLLSLGGIARTVDKAVPLLRRQALVASSTTARIDDAAHDLTADAAGEADLVLFRPQGTLRFGGAEGVNVPAALLWPVSDDNAAERNLQDAVARLQLSKHLQADVAGGVRFHSVKGTSMGYAVRNHWAMISFTISRTLGSLSTHPSGSLASLPAYADTLPRGGRLSSSWYLDIHGVRKALEASFLSGASSPAATIYRSNVLPLIAPLQSFSGGTATSSDPHISLSTATLRIGPAR